MHSKINMIIPILGYHSFDKIPVEFQVADNGYMNCINSILASDLTSIDMIYIAISKEDNVHYYGVLAQMLDFQLNKCGLTNHKIFIYNERTSSQVETVARVIIDGKLAGKPIFVHDVDVCFTHDELTTDNSVIVYSLEEMCRVDPQHKSYVSIDENRVITNIIEKRVVSDLFACGGYVFKDASQFMEAFTNIKSGHRLYLSNIIYYMMLNMDEVFVPVFADDYVDFSIE